jgi:two-component system, chemotaxis family, response regulator Rcp1
MGERLERDSVAEILLVEDNEGDVRLTREALRQCRFTCRLHVVRDGVEAVAFLRGEHPYADAPRPHFLLLDLNLPRKSGHEVLREIKEDDQLRTIPVMVLSTSQDPTDLRAAYNNYANCYLIKPADLDEFFRMVSTLESFWLGTAALPSSSAGSSPTINADGS